MKISSPTLSKSICTLKSHRWSSKHINHFWVRICDRCDKKQMMKRGKWTTITDDGFGEIVKVKW